MPDTKRKKNTHAKTSMKPTSLPEDEKPKLGNYKSDASIPTTNKTKKRARKS